MNAARVFVLGGVFALRGLFNWLHPAMLVPALVGVPLFQMIFFVYMGRAGAGVPDSFFVVGNAVQACGMATVYGAVMVISNDRSFGTLPFVLNTPASRVALFFGRGAPFFVLGLLSSALGLVAGGLLFEVEFAGSPALLALVLVVVVASCTAFGLALGTVGLRAREPLFLAALAYSLMLLVCGVNVPLARLPDWLEAVGQALPLTHGIDATRGAVAGVAAEDVMADVAWELAIGAAYAVAAFALYRWFERRARAQGTLEII